MNIPVPKDIPLPLPLPEWLLIALLIVSFLMHILFVNLMLGGTLLSFWYQVKGLKEQAYDYLAKEIANTVTVNKSLAVVLGVAPLLCINVLYTIYFYSANALTGNLWISLVPWIAFVFLILYLHKYTWESFHNNKPLHIGLLGIAVGSFLFIPLVFLSNINLMLFPDKWGEVKGFASIISLANVVPRYLHFVMASLAITGLFLFWYFGRNAAALEEKCKGLSIYNIRKRFYSLALGITIAQFVFGPLVLITLPVNGVSWGMILFISLAVIFALYAIYRMWKDIQVEQILGRKFYHVVIALSFTVVFMGIGRHEYRAGSLQAHQELMNKRTQKHAGLVEQAHQLLISGEQEVALDTTGSPGLKLFEQNCAICHHRTNMLVGPPVTEIFSIYRANKDKMIEWIKNPGRKRTNLPPMTGFPDMPEKQLEAIAEYILTGGM